LHTHPGTIQALPPSPRSPQLGQSPRHPLRTSVRPSSSLTPSKPASGNAILQPVLQYGPSAAGGGSYWALASWYLVGSSTFYTTLVTTSTGSVLNGLITLTGSSGSSYNYESTFTGISATALAATGSDQLVWATETLEAYGVNTISNYPSGSTVFSGINLSTSAGTPAVSWTATSDSADGLTTTINTQGASNAKVTVSY